VIDGGRFAGHDLRTGEDHPIAAVIAAMDREGVARALVSSFRSVQQDIVEGARECVRWAAAAPERVVPVAALTTSFYGSSPDRLLPWMRDELGIRVVAITDEPSLGPVQWDAPIVRAIALAAADAGLVLQAGIRSAAELAAVSRAASDLPLDVMVRWLGGHRYLSVASEVALAERWPRVIFDVGTMASTGLIAWSAARLGAHRLFLSTNAPVHVAAAPLAVLADADLSADQRQAISGGTAARVLGLAAPAGAVVVSPLDRLRDRPKVDTHWHPDHNNLGEPGIGDAAQIAEFDRFAYERVVCSANRALYDELDVGNEAVAGWADRDPRVRGLVVIDPRRPGASLAQIERYAADRRFVGLKTIQDLSDSGLDDAAYDPLLARAAALGLPVLAHITGMAGAAKRHPDVKFIAAHANFGRAQALAEARNVFFDVSTSHALAHETQLARFIRLVGTDRVLFGSDGPLVSPAWTLAKIGDVALSDDELDRILRRNAYRVFARLSAS